MPDGCCSWQCHMHKHAHACTHMHTRTHTHTHRIICSSTSARTNIFSHSPLLMQTLSPCNIFTNPAAHSLAPTPCPPLRPPPPPPPGYPTPRWCAWRVAPPSPWTPPLRMASCCAQSSWRQHSRHAAECSFCARLATPQVRGTPGRGGRVQD